MTRRTPQLTARDRLIADRIGNGETYAALIAEYGLNRQQLWRICKAHGVKARRGRPRTAKPKRKRRDESPLARRDAEIMRKFHSAIAAIASEYGLSRERVRQIVGYRV